MVHNTSGPRILRIIPLLMVMGTIFYFSHQTGETLKLPNVIGIDKIAHGVEYGVLAAAACYAAQPLLTYFSGGWVGTGVVFFCFIYALSDEFHQSFIPGRCVSGWDVLADVVGATVIMLIWRRKTRPTEEIED